MEINPETARNYLIGAITAQQNLSEEQASILDGWTLYRALEPIWNAGELQVPAGHLFLAGRFWAGGPFFGYSVMQHGTFKWHFDNEAQAEKILREDAA